MHTCTKYQASTFGRSKRIKRGIPEMVCFFFFIKLKPAGIESRRQLAVSVGYSQSVADKVTEKIESTEGYANAMAALASETGNVALKALNVLKNRDLSKETTAQILDAIETLGRAWDRFTPQIVKADDNAKRSSLRSIILEDSRVIDAEVKQEANEIDQASDDDF